MTKFLNVLFGGLLTCTLLLTSCSEDASVLGLEDTENFVDDSFSTEFAAERGGAKCLELVYPVTIIFPDETTMEVADAEAQREAIKGWIEENGKDAGKPALEYPVSVITSDDETVEVADTDALKELLSECKGNKGNGDGRRGGNGRKGNAGFGKCLDLVYPVTILFPDGTSAEVADAEAQKDTIKGWLMANGKDAGKPELQFPVSVTNSDDETVEVADADALKELAQACRGDRGPKCFTLVFPVTITFPDATTTEVNDRSEMRASLKEWKEANPDSEERPALTFPLSVELEDGTTQEVASSEDLDALKEECKG